MLAWVVAAVAAAIAGILVGFWLRSAAAKAELNAVRGELAQARAEAAEWAGFVALAAERENALKEVRDELQSKAATEVGLTARVKELEAELRNERQNMADKLALLEEAKRTLADQFQSLAGQVLEDKAKTFSESSQTQMGALLTPLREQIEGFRKKVEEAQSDSKTGVAELKTWIALLAEQSKQMGEKADGLATALRGSSKAQGDWGEFILRDLLEKAGLREDEQFTFQQSFSGIEDGDRTRAVRTDVILKLPGGRCLVIDSKVSLTAYTDYINAAVDASRPHALKQHLASMRGHVASLAKSGYHGLPGIETPDFVVMFVSVEPAFLLALQNDGELWADAYRQGILLVGPTTLLYIIRIVNVLWQQETQARNVKEVMDRGAKLYEKFAGFVGDIEAIGDSLRNASSSYEDARKKLSEGPGNLVKQVEMLRQLGVKPRKTLPLKFLETAGVEEPTLALTADGDGDGV